MRVARYLLASVVVLVAGPCWADEPLAGSTLIVATRSSPICSSEASLQRFLVATVQHEPVAALPTGCSYAPAGSRAAVLEDLPISNATMHVIKARFDFAFPLGSVVGYTYSKGFEPRGYPFNAGTGYQAFTYFTGPGF